MIIARNYFRRIDLAVQKSSVFQMKTLEVTIVDLRKRPRITQDFKEISKTSQLQKNA